MKKFIYIAIMAVAVVFASCQKEEVGNSNYYKTHDIVIDWEAGTINGKAYDNTVEKCWKLDVTQSYIVTVTVQEYCWGTELYARTVGEGIMYTYGKTGIKATYKMAAAPEFKDSESCLANNDEE